ncbi:MAG: peptidylprolyl isomerase [Bacillota bacterium]
MSKKNTEQIQGSDVSATNRVMFIVLGVILVTFVIVMVLMFNKGQLPQTVPSGVKKVLVEMKIKDRGTMKLELRNDLMPKTVNNFVRNIMSGYYDGRKFFRADNYMTSAGSPTDEAGVDNREPVDLETNKELNVERYSIGMGKDTPTNKSSQSIFFIAKAKEADFNQKYAVFGKITDIPSQKILDRLQENDVIEKVTVISYDGNTSIPSP